MEFFIIVVPVFQYSAEKPQSDGWGRFELSKKLAVR
jgi:hypothetical protein